MNLAYPFSLISGKGLGVSYSSLTQIGAALPSRDFGVLKMQSFINVNTGNHIIFDHKMVIQENNFPLEFYYVYNSHVQTMADIWRFAHKRFKLLPTSSQTSPAILIEKDGHETCYQFDSKTNCWVAPYWSDSRPYLKCDTAAKNWIWFDPKTQITEIYHEQGYLLERFDSRNERTTYHYDTFATPWRLTDIQAPGSAYEFRQRLVNGERIESIYQVYLGSSTLLRSSVFDIDGRLRQTRLPSKDPDRAKWPRINFIYQDKCVDPATLTDKDVFFFAYLDSVEQMDGSNLTFRCDDVISSAALRRITEVSYPNPTDSGTLLIRFSYQHRNTVVKSYTKITTKLYFNEQGSITQIDRERGYPFIPWSLVDSCFYSYNDLGQLASITSAGQGKQSFQYEESNGLLIKHQKASGQVTEYYYDETSPRHNLIAQVHIVNGKAQVIRKVYDQAFSENRGLYLRFEISPEGRVTEYRYEYFGYIQYTLIYLEGRFPIEQYPKNAVPNLSQMASWVAQQNLQKISLTESQDYNGIQRRQTYYYETINAQGEGVKDDRMSLVITHYTPFGDLCFHSEYRKTTDKSPLYTFRNYDNIRRLLSNKNAAEEITRYQYDNRHIQITRPNNRKEITELDVCGWICKEQQTIQFNNQPVTRETTYRRNILDCCTEKCTTADGQFSYRFYDKQNRLGFIVYPSGRLTEYRYDAQNRNKITIRYAKNIDIKKLAALTEHEAEPTINDLSKLMQQMAIVDPEHDHFSYEFYDQSDRLSYQVDEESYFCQTIYNDRDAVIAQIKYATQIKPEQLAALLKGKSITLSPDPKRDRIQRKFYDADQQLIGLQDAAGYVTEYKRNGANWVTEIIRYAQKQIISINTQNFDKIRPTVDASDAHEYAFYNPRAWVVLTVDAEGYVATKDYLLNGLVHSEKRYANAVDSTWYNNTQSMPILPTESADQTITYKYDVLNREIESRRSDGKVTFTHYDNMGEIIAKGVRDAAMTEITGDSYRANETRFDGWSQALAVASAQNSELLARIDADSTLKPEEKQRQKEKIWNENTRRHVYDASGLKLSTAVRSSPEIKDQLTYFYYDSERHLILTIQVVADKQFQIREYTRDNFTNIVKIRDYSQVQATLADKFNQPLTGGFIPDALRTALDALQNDMQDVITQKFYNKRDEVIKFVDAEGFETQHIANAFFEVSQSSLPVQTKQATLVIQHQYDARGLEIITQRQADTLNIKVKRAYRNLYGKTTHIRDELKGDYQNGYDRKGRLIWTQNPLQQQRSHIAYDAWDKPTKNTNALGLTTQHRYDLKQRSATTVDPLGNKRTIIHNIFAEKIKEIDAKQHTQTWQHAADGQISRYTDALGRGYVAVYNLLGFLTEKQILNGIKTNYVYDAIGHLITKLEDVNGSKRQTQYQYNLLGHCIKTIDAKGIVQQSKYDRRGLVIEQDLDAQESGLNLTTMRQYNGQGKLVSESQGDVAVVDQYTRQLDYDGLSRHCATIIDPLTETRKAALNIQTRQHKNGQDRVLAEIDANGHVMRFIMDAAGRRCFKINALGGVTEWKYNQVGQIILEREYQQGITGNEVTSINDETTPEQLRALLQINSEDTLCYQFYDANGKQRFSVSCNGQQAYIKEKRYDVLQREVQTIQYVAGIAIQSIGELTTEKLEAEVIKIVNPTQDRCHYFLRDEVGQLRFSIAPQNYVHEQRFDEQGHLIGQISYANPVEDALHLSQLPIAEVISHLNKEDSQDRYQFFFFDSLGQPRYTVKSEGQVLSYQHDANGNLIEEVHFSQRLNVPQAYLLLLQQLQALKPDATQDRITRKVYDAANRLIQHTDALGYVETYQYDALGNRTRYSDWQQSIWKTVFDRAKRPTIEITPPVYIVEVTANASGALAWVGNSIPIEKHKAYDKVGNIASIISAANTKEPRVFEAEYNGLNQWQRTHLPDIAVDNGSTLKPDDWRHRSETKQTLTSARTTNAKGLKVAEQDAAGHWQFWVYDQQKRLVYHVKPLGVTIKKERDAFGKIHRKIIFATPCTLDLSIYIKTGILKSVLDDYYQARQTELDRITSYQRDQRGQIILQRQGPVYCYAGAPLGKISEEYAEIRKAYNAWGQLIAQTEKIDPTRKKENFYWFDRSGQRLAEVDTVGLDNQTPQCRCQRFENDSFGQMVKRIAYAKSLDASINARLPFVELKQRLEQLASTRDRCDQFYYDKANRLVKKVRLQAIRQTLLLTSGLPRFTDAPPQDISVGYQYNGNGQMIAKTLEDGSMEWSFYDPRGCKVAQVDVPRDNHALTNLIVPLTYYANNPYGQPGLITRFQTGTLLVVPGRFPKPIASVPADQRETRLYDMRGKLQWKQSDQRLPRGFSYTANGKPARQWWTLSNWQQKDGNQYQTKIHLDEKFFQYDAQNRAINVEVRRDAQTVETTCTQYDAFDQAILEGDKPDSLSIYRRFDQLGRLWCSNTENGIPTLYLHDLTGQCVLRMQSATKDLGFMTYRELPSVLSWSIIDVERTANQRDLAGRIINRSLPANYQVDTSQPQIIPLSILASNRYPDLGKIQSLSWPIPQEKNAVAEFSLWPKDFPAQKHILPIVTQEGRCGVDVSALASDVYQYEILYYFSNGNEAKKLLYISSNIIQIETNSSAQSQHLVVITDQEQPSLVRLVGNTRDITRVELWQDFEKIATLDLQLDPKTQHYFVDLSRYISGVYQLKPQKQAKATQSLSLAFTIYTDKPAIAPLSREISSTLNFCFLANHIEMNWQLPKFLQTQPVKLQCHYIDAQDQKQIYEGEISPKDKRTTYTDKNGQKIQSNVSFDQPIKAIEAVSLSVKYPAENLTANLARLKDHWLLLATTSGASSDEEEWEMIPRAASSAADDEKDWIPLYQNEIPIPPAEAPPPFDPTIINDFSFKDKHLLMVTSVLNLKELKTPPILEYLDVSLDRMRCWKQFAMIKLITPGFVVDVTGFQAGVYPFRYQGNTGNLVITLGGQVFPTQSMNEPDRQRLMQPSRRYSYDLWNNKLTETDTLGHITQYIYNDADQIIQKQEPLVDVVDEQGNTQALCPITTFAYNTRGLQIAKRDANGHTSGLILDAAGHRIIEVLANGTHRKTQLFDAFNNIIEIRDAANQATKYFYDQENNLLAFQKPSGSRRSYTYNEQKQRNSDADPLNNICRYNFDVLGNLIERYERLGQCTQMFYGRYHQPTQQINPDGSRLTWQRDTFGKAVQHTDLSGAVYRYGYDCKAQLVDVNSQGGKHGEYMELVPLTFFGSNSYKQVINPVPGQSLHYQYISGRVTEIDDLATGKKTYYSYDSEGRRFAVRVVSQSGEILRETTSQIDALGREILTRDQQAIFTTAYDAVSNRRFIKAVINTGGRKGQLTQETWWKYDIDDKVILAEGILENAQIKITPIQGSEFTYQDDRRVTEKQLDKFGNAVIASLQYDTDGRLTGSLYNTGERTERQYSAVGRQFCYKDILQPNRLHIQHEQNYNENGWQISTDQSLDEDSFIHTDYQNFTALGLPQQQTIYYKDSANNQDHLNYNYVGWDSWRVASIEGYRSNIYGRSAYSSVKNFLGPNGEPNAILGAQSDSGTKNKYFKTTSDGLVLSRINYGFYPLSFSVRSLLTYYFYRVNGQYLGSYEIDKDIDQDFFDLILNWVRHGQSNGAGRELGILHGNNPGRAISFDPLTEKSTGQTYGGLDYFSDIPKTYVCITGDSYTAIAEKIYGDASLASYIDAANGGGALIAGQTIVIPQLISVHNKAGMARPYYQLLQIIQGSLMPHLDTPQPPPPDDDDDFFGFLFKAIVVVVICVAAPEIAPAFVSTLTATLGTAGALAVGAGLADAAAQGLCIGLGVQDHFSFAELATTMITAGFGAQLSPLEAGASAAQWTEFIVRAGMVNVEEQLAEMAIGIRQQFDLAGVALAMGAAGLNTKIKLDNPLERRLLADVGAAAMSGVVRGRFDVENLAAQLITDTAGYVAQQIQAKPVLAAEYHQSQKASRGEGKITQTAIEQQWESQLINDAEFTANMPLPSVTLDVNNAYVAQQLGQGVGEEVSRFQHVTPVRNPNGFWRGVDDVLKMREGTIEAVSSVFTNNYQEPNDRWQKLGYELGIPLAMGAEFIATEGVLGLETIENVYQGTQQVFGNVTSKLERWGLFGSKQLAAENLPNYAAYSRADALRLNTIYALQEAGILGSNGKLTSYAVENTTIALAKGSILSNPSVVDALTENGGNITEWSKFASPSVKLSSGQKIEVHFYKKIETDEVNYTHPDFKVKGIVEAIPKQRMQDPIVNQSFLSSSF